MQYFFGESENVGISLLVVTFFTQKVCNTVEYCGVNGEVGRYKNRYETSHCISP